MIWLHVGGRRKNIRLFDTRIGRAWDNVRATTIVYSSTRSIIVIAAIDTFFLSSYTVCVRVPSS